MRFGTYKRKNPKVQVLRGYDPQHPTTLTASLPVDQSVDAEPIYSGMVISPSKDGKKWQVGVDSTSVSSKNQVAVAVYGSDEPELLTEGCGKLVGLLCLGKFRIGTPYFMRTTGATETNKVVSPGTLCSYTVGTPLTYATEDDYDAVTIHGADADGRYTTKQVRRNCKGFIKPAGANDPVIGVVSAEHTGINGVGVDVTTAQRTAYLVPEGAWGLQVSPALAVDSSSEMDNAYLVVFDTTFTPKA